MAEKFNLAALLDNVSEINTERKQIEYLPMAALFSDPNNRYELSGIEELAANIEMFGLQQPLEVRPSKEQEGRYIVTSGHRRKAALELLGEAEAPCIVVEPMGSEALQELRLIFANSDTRRMTPAELMWQAQRVKELFYALKEEGHEFPGRMRDHVSAVMKMSKSKLGRLEAIQNNLKPTGLRKAFELGQINEATAYEISKRGEAVQERAETMCEELCTVTTEEAQRILEGIEQDLKKPKPVPLASNPIVRQPNEVQPGKAAAMDYLNKAASENIDYFKLMDRALENFLPRMMLAFNRKDNIDAMKRALLHSGGGHRGYNYGGCGPGLDLSSFNDAIPNIRRSWTEAYDFLCAAALQRLKRELKKTVPKINTAAPEWQTGTPENGGKYYCKVEVEGVSVHQILIYDKGWTLPAGGHALDECCTVLGWWPLPEE